MWTVQRVKDELPDVQVKYKGLIHTCAVRGRKNQFASVYVGDFTVEYSWETITRSLNHNTPLLVTL